jgi:hypothetical protein
VRLIARLRGRWEMSRRVQLAQLPQASRCSWLAADLRAASSESCWGSCGGSSVRRVHCAGLLLGCGLTICGASVEVQSPSATPSSSDAVAGPAEKAACGPACAALVMRWFRLPVRSYELTSLRASDGSTDLGSIAKALTAAGLVVAVRETTLAEIRAWPGVAILRVESRADSSVGHFVVKVPDGRDDRPIDPTVPPGVDARMPWETLDESWVGAAAFVSSPRVEMAHSLLAAGVAAAGLCAGFAVGRLWRNRQTPS